MTYLPNPEFQISRVEHKELIILCDESEKHGAYCSNFYGGVLVGSSDHDSVLQRLRSVKDSLNLFREVKWNRVTAQHVKKYEALMGAFFDEVQAGRVKVRIMFSQNSDRPMNLSREDHGDGYFKLYYQFFKHGFGLRFIEPKGATMPIRIYLDRLPDTAEKIEQFKGYLLGL